MPVIIPSPQREEDLRYIHKHLSLHRIGGDNEALAKAVKRMLSVPDFQREMARVPALQKPVKSPADLLTLAWSFFYMYLNRRDYVAAALIIWGPITFTPKPHCAQLMWNSLFNYNLTNVMGCASVGKSFCPSAWCLLDWVLDPEWTRVSVVSNSEDHVKKNLFGDMIRLHSESALELPGRVDSESISLDKKRAFGIFVLTIPGGPLSRGKIKGSKIKNRPHHPLFGDNSRLRVILDEAQEIAANVYDELPNLLASVDNSTEHIKILAAANCKDEWSKYGQNCKPKGGWEKITDDAEEWESETGWHVISINAMKTENVMARRTIFPRMITYEGVQKIIRSQAGGNDQSPICFTFIYGRFPKTGLLSTVIKAEHLRRSEGEWIFNESTTSLASTDPAFTGDLPTMATGRVGRAVGWTDYAGVRHDLSEPRIVIQVDAVGILSRGDSQDLADEIMGRCKQMSVRPYGYGIDKTGVGLGVHDIVRRQWDAKVGKTDISNDGGANIVGINYAQSPTDFKICDEDTETPKESFDRIATELYYAASKLIEYDCVRFGRGVDAKTFEELASRRGGSQVGLGRKQTLEGKDAYKSRTGENSPDRADCVTILLHVARISTPGLIPRAKDTIASVPQQPVHAWAGFDQSFDAAQLDGFGADAIADLQKD